jgi:hypothetical protein
MSAVGGQADDHADRRQWKESASDDEVARPVPGHDAGW